MRQKDNEFSLRLNEMSWQIVWEADKARLEVRLEVNYIISRNFHLFNCKMNIIMSLKECYDK